MHRDVAEILVACHLPFHLDSVGLANACVHLPQAHSLRAGTPPSPRRGRRPPPCFARRSHHRARTSGTAAGSRGARRGSRRRPGALPCTSQINRTTHQSRNLHLAQSAEWTRCIRTSYTRGVKGRRHKVQRSTVRSMETLVSCLVSSCSVCMISPSLEFHPPRAQPSLALLGPGHYKALPSHIHTTSRCIKSTHASIKRRVTACMHVL